MGRCELSRLIYGARYSLGLFLGVGLIAGTPEWGAMLNEARNSVYSNPGLIIYPGICLIVCCAGFNLLGEELAVIIFQI